MIRDVKNVAGAVPLSATIGDFNYKPGTASLAALGAAVAVQITSKLDYSIYRQGSKPLICSQTLSVL